MQKVASYHSFSPRSAAISGAVLPLLPIHSQQSVGPAATFRTLAIWQLCFKLSSWQPVGFVCSWSAELQFVGLATSLCQLSPAAISDCQLALLQSISMRHHEHHNVFVSNQEGKQRLQIHLPAQFHCHLSALLHPISSAAVSCVSSGLCDNCSQLSLSLSAQVWMLTVTSAVI